MDKLVLFHLKILFLQKGKNLLPGDLDGNSDPKVMVTYYGKTAFSKTIKKTLNPVNNYKNILSL
jgi:Ca2+-dependent lipid-binding protein